MKIKKLKIETHISNKNEQAKSFKINKTSNIKNIKYFKKLFKAKLEDRNKIKGINFSTFKTEGNNNLLLYKLKKKEEATTFELTEANYLRSLRDYNQLKHEIYLKDLKEKKVKTNEALFNEKIIKKDISYSFIKETLYQFMRFKKNHNKYNTSLLKNKNELKRESKIAKSNFINKAIKNVEKHFHQITGKIDMGVSRKEEIMNEKEYDNLIEQISKSRLKHLKSYEGKNNSNKKDTTPVKLLESKNPQNFTTKNRPSISYFRNFSHETPKNEEIKNEFILNLKNNYKNKTVRENDSNNIRNLNEICKTDSNINQNIKLYEKRHTESEKSVNRISRSLPTKKAKRKPNTTKFKTHILPNPIQINDNFFNKNPIKTSIYNIKELEKENDSNDSINSNTNKSNLKQEKYIYLDKKNDSSLIIKDLINLEKFKINNLLKEKKNPAYWNTKRLKTAESRNHKVINKPLYVAKISDFVNEYKRIKSVSKSAKKRMIEKHYTTLENIDKISKIKEELLMFILKNKYFHCAFPQKKIKTISKKELFVKKFKTYLNIIDNPYSLATKELKAELMKYEGL